MSAAAETTRRRATFALRDALLRGTALALCAGATGPAWAQATLPVVSNAGGAAITRNAATGKMSVDLLGANRIVTYGSFNLGTSSSSSETLTFLNSGAAGSLSVLNKVTGGSGSTIYGTITAPSSISVWLVDPAGVTFGPTGSFSGGSLIVSTLPLASAQEAAFLAGTLTSTNLAGASTNSIVFQSGGGTITATGSIVAVAQRIDAGKTVTSSGGSVALVAGSDVTFTNGVGSPLSFAINAGTTIGTAAVNVTGNASGQNIRIAGGAQNALSAALLSVDQNATLTATAAGGTVVLATASDAGITIANGAGLTPDITAGGLLQANGANGDVVVTSAGAAAIAGNVTAIRDYLVTGGTGVTLGKANASVLQSAGRAVTVTATTGDIIGLGSLTLQAAQTDSTRSLTLNGADGGSAINFGTGTTLIGGIPGARVDVSVKSGTSIDLGNVIANRLGNIGDEANLTLVTPSTLGNITVEQALFVKTTAGDLKLGGATSNTGSVTVIAAGNAEVDGNVSAAGDYAVTGGSGVVLGDGQPRTQAAKGAVTITAAGGDITGNAGLTLQSNSDGAGAEPLKLLAAAGKVAFANSATPASTSIVLGGTASGLSDVTIANASTVTLGDVTAKSLRTDGNPTTLTSAGAITLGHVSVTDSLTVVSDGAIRLIAASSASDISLTSNNSDVSGLARASAATDGRLLPNYDRADLTTTTAGKKVTVSAALGTAQLGSVSAGVNDLTSLGADQISVTADRTDVASATALNGNIGLLAIGGDVRAGTLASGKFNLDGSVKVAGNAVVNALAGNATVYGDVAAAGNYSVLANDAVTLGQNAATVTQEAAGAVTASSDIMNVSGLGSLTLRSDSDANGGEALTLNAPGGNVSFGPATQLFGGKDGTTAPVVVVTSPGSGTVTLGTVTAKRLSSGGASLVATDNIDIGAVTVVDPLAIDSTAGNVRIGTATSKTGGISIIAAGTAEIDRDIDAAGDYQVNAGAGVTLGDGSARTQKATGAVSVIANAGDIVGNGALTLKSDVNNANAAASAKLAARNGNIAFGPSTVITGGTADILITASGNIDFGSAGPTAGTVALLAGGRVSGGTVSAGEDVSVKANGAVTFGAVTAGDDIDVATGGNFNAASLTLTGAGPDTRAVSFVAAAGDPNAISVAAAGPDGRNIRISALSIGTAPAAGDTGQLIVGALTAGSVTATADAGDIRIGTATATAGNVGVTATSGSVSGLSTIRALAGGIDISAPGAALSLTATDPNGFVRLGTVTAGSLTAVAPDHVQLASGTVSGDVTLHTTAGTAAVVDLTAVPLLPDFGRASLTASPTDSLISVQAGRAAQLGTLTAGQVGDPRYNGTQIKVVAGAIDITRAEARGGDLTLDAAGRVTLTTGLAPRGTIAILAGQDVSSSDRLAAGEDVSVRAGGMASFAAITAGDDIDLWSDGALSLNNATTDGTGADTRFASLSLGAAGTGTGIVLGSPEDPALAGSNIRIRAASIGGPALVGSTGTGLILRDLTGRRFDVTANAGDIRIGQLTATADNIAVAASAGSVSGLQDGWTATSGGSALSTTGKVILDAPGSVEIGSVTSGSIVNGPGATPATLRIGQVNVSGSIALTANTGLEIDTGFAAGNVTLQTLGGVPDAIAGSAPFVANFGRANLTASATDKLISVQAARAAQLDALIAGQIGDPRLNATQIGVRAGAIDITSAEARGGDLTADSGGQLILGTGIAPHGTIALLAGGPLSSGSLSAGEDISARSGGAAAFGSLQAGDDIDLWSDGALSLASATTNGAGPDTRFAALTLAAAGTGTGIVLATPENPALAGSNIRIKAASIGGPALSGSTDAGLVVNNLTASGFAVTANGGDIRLGSLRATMNDVGVTAGGSVSGLRDNWVATSGGSTLNTTGQVILDSPGSVEIGSVTSRTLTNAPGTASTIRIGQVTIGNSVALTADTGLQIDTGSAGGSVTLQTLGGTHGSFEITAAQLVPGYGRSQLTAGAGSVTVNAGAAAQLGTLSAGQNVGITAAALDVTRADALGGTLSLLAHNGLLRLGDGSALTTATLTKNDDDLPPFVKNPAFDLLVVTGTVAGRDVALSSRTDISVNSAFATAGNLDATAGMNVRIGQAQAAAGNITITAQAGDVTGLSRAIPATDGRLLPNVDRGDLNAAGPASRILIRATAGNVQLGAVHAGVAGAAPFENPAQIDAQAGAIDVTDVAALNGNLALAATGGRLWVDTGSAALDAVLNQNGASDTLLVKTSLKTGRDATLSAGASDALAATLNVGRNLGMYAAGNALVGTATAGGTIAIKAGTDVGGYGAGAGQPVAGEPVGLGAALSAGEDVAISAGRSAVLGNVAAGDDIDVAAGTQISVVAANATGLGADASRVVFGANSASIDSSPAAASSQTGGNITLTSGTVLADNLSTQRGDILVNAGARAVVTNAAAHAGTANKGSITIFSGPPGGSFTSTGTLSADEDVSVRSGGAANFNVVNAGDDIDIWSDGAVSLSSAKTTGSSLDGRSAFLPNLTGSNIRIKATALTGPAMGGSTDTGLVVRDLTGGSFDLKADTGDVRLGQLTATAGDIGVIATAGSASGLSDNFQPATGGSTLATPGQLILDVTGPVSAGTVTAGMISNIATPDSIRLGQITTSSVDLTARTGLQIDGGKATGAVKLHTTGGAASAAAMSGTLINGHGGANLSANAAGAKIGVTAGQAAQLGTVSADGQIDVMAGALSATSAIAQNGPLSLLAGKGSAALGTGTAGAGDLTVNAKTDITVATGTAAKGAIVLIAGNGINATTLTATVEDVAAKAGQNATFGTVTAGDNITLEASNGLLTIGQTKTTGNGADNRTFALDTAAAGTAAAIQPGAANAPDGEIRLSGTDMEVKGSVTSGGASSSIYVRNLGKGAATTAIGDGPAGTFVLKQAEVNSLNANNVVIDSGAQNVTFGALAVDADTGVSALRFLTTGSIGITKEISGSGKGVLQIGGAGIADPSGLITDPGTLANQITADIGTGDASAKISFANGIVDLRARRIVFGHDTLIAKYLPQNGTPLSNAAVALDVANAASALYTGDASLRVFLKARLMRVSYSDFALFQNTGSTVGGGVELNKTATPNVTDLALQLFSSGGDKDNSFALFGSINGFIGRAAGILPNGILEIVAPNAVPRVVRITQANSRVNGCVIGSPDKGCLVNDPPRPNFSIYDQRQTQLFGRADDATLFFNPLVGRGNEGLIVDIGYAPVGIDTIECAPDDKTCSESGDKK